MQTQSIYSQNYSPLFINEMDEGATNAFAHILSQKLRNVKMAITKANLSNNKLNNRIEKEELDKIQIHLHTQNQFNKHKKDLKTEIDDEKHSKSHKKKLNPVNINFIL